MQKYPQMGSSFISTGSGWPSQTAKRAFSCHFVMSMKSGAPRESCHMGCDLSPTIPYNRTYRRPPLFCCLLFPSSLFCDARPVVWVWWVPKLSPCAICPNQGATAGDYHTPPRRVWGSNNMWGDHRECQTIRGRHKLVRHI